MNGDSVDNHGYSSGNPELNANDDNAACDFTDNSESRGMHNAACECTGPGDFEGDDLPDRARRPHDASSRRLSASPLSIASRRKFLFGMVSTPLFASVNTSKAAPLLKTIASQ